jgi:hypothetical protein
LYRTTLRRSARIVVFVVVETSSSRRRVVLARRVLRASVQQRANVHAAVAVPREAVRIRRREALVEPAKKRRERAREPRGAMAEPGTKRVDVAVL